MVRIETTEALYNTAKNHIIDLLRIRISDWNDPEEAVVKVRLLQYV
jgi:hypothetical protein